MTETVLREETNYYPHLGLTGNITANESVFRYYGGFIADEEGKLYVGSDYTTNFSDLDVHVGAIGYTNPDQEYFSKVNASVGRTWEVSSDTALTISSQLRYALDRPEEEVLDDPIDNQISIGATLEMGPVSLNAKRLFDILPDSTGNQIRAGVGFQFGNYGAINAFFVPQRDIDTFGISGQYNISNDGLFQKIIVQWHRSVFDFGEDQFGNDLKEGNDTFSILLNFSGS